MTSAPAVSRALARAGFRPLPAETPRTREGIRVKRGGLGAVFVVVDFDSHSGAARRSKELEEVLDLAGYDVERVSPTILRVNRREQA